MASNWNRLVDGLARTGLGEHEQRVLMAVARKTLGYRKVSDRLPISQIGEIAGLDRQNVSRALGDLQARNIIWRVGGSVGRGNAATITLNLDSSTWRKKSSGDTTKKSRPARDISRREKSSPETTEKSSHGTHSIGRGVKQVAKVPTEVRERAFAAYTEAGGGFGKDEHRAFFARQVGAAWADGASADSICAAAAIAGRDRDVWISGIREKANLIQAGGGPCRWEEIGRTNLTDAQLRECGCGKCLDLAEHRLRNAAGAAA